MKDGNLVHGYANAAFANNESSHSTTGYVFKSFKGAITWRLWKQNLIVHSSTEAEYIALSEAAREAAAAWLHNLYLELGFHQPEPITIFGDNDGSREMANNPQFHKCTKHIEIRYHSIREQIQKRYICVEPIRDPDQTADILTKVLFKPKHKKCTAKLGIAYLA